MEVQLTEEVQDGRRLRGDRTKRAILAKAVDLASVEGLEGLSIGRLASELGVSKSGLFAHFGSKLELSSKPCRPPRSSSRSTCGSPSPTSTPAWSSWPR